MLLPRSLAALALCADPDAPPSRSRAQTGKPKLLLEHLRQLAIYKGVYNKDDRRMHIAGALNKEGMFDADAAKPAPDDDDDVDDKQDDDDDEDDE